MTGMLTLFGSLGSGSAAVECALRRCDQPYRVVRASTWEADSAQEALRRINPLGQIPTLLLADGTVMTESAAILIHLGLQHPKSALLPAAAAARALTLRGLVFIAANCYAAISVGDYPERWTTASTRPARDKVRAAARAQLHRAWEIFADSIVPPLAEGGAPYLGGAAPGALDYLTAVVSKWSGTRAHVTKARPKFSALLKRIEADALVAEVFAAHWPAR